MSASHDVTDNIVYDLVSVQYHALQALESYTSYLDDAHQAEHDEISEFIQRCQEQDRERAWRCHELLGDLVGHRPGA